MRRTLSVAVMAAALTLSACLDLLPPTADPGAETGIVLDVLDGDTIDVEINGIEHRVRYIGINAPEWDEVCGREATDANNALVGGQTVTLVKDVSETDRYGRLLRYVYVGDVFVNGKLVAEGWAEARSYPPDTAQDALLEELEAQAREAWIGCYPSGAFGN